MKGLCHVMGKFERRIVFTLFQEYDRLPAYTDPLREIILCQREPGTVLLDPGLHSTTPVSLRSSVNVPFPEEICLVDYRGKCKNNN